MDGWAMVGWTQGEHPEMIRRPDVAMVIYSLGGGGAERAVANLAGAMASRGLVVDLVLCRAEGPYLEEIPDSVQVVDCNANSSIQWRSCLSRYLREHGPQAALATMEGAGVVTLWARRSAGAPTRVVVCSQNTLSRHSAAAVGLKERHLLRWFVRWFYRGADGIVAISQGVADDLARTGWLSREAIQVIHNPVVTEKSLALASEPVDYPWLEADETETLVSAGRLTPQKDFPTLLRAFERVTRNRKVRLAILGEGEDRPELESLAKELEIQDKVFFPGFVKNPHAVYSRADLFVLSSAWEGLGNVLVEAMASGCPVLSTDCPHGPAEILARGRYGPLVPVGDVGALAEGMVSVLDSPPSEESLRARAMDFHVDRITDAYLTALGLVEQGGRGV